MREEEVFVWRVQWIGKWVKTRYHSTEEFIRSMHPEATKVEGSRIVRMLPETVEELRADHFNPSRGLMHPDGTPMMLWEQPPVGPPQKQP